MAGRGTDIKLGGNKDVIMSEISSDVNEHKKNELKVKGSERLSQSVQKARK